MDIVKLKDGYSCQLVGDGDLEVYGSLGTKVVVLNLKEYDRFTIANFKEIHFNFFDLSSDRAKTRKDIFLKSLENVYKII